jgi:Tfp pilus assembly protein PilF
VCARVCFCRLEQEAKRQEELQRQLEKQRKIEMEREEQRRKMLEQKEVGTLWCRILDD